MSEFYDDHIESVESEDWDMAYSLYSTPTGHVAWIKVGMAVLELPLELLDDFQEMLGMLKETANDIKGEATNAG